MHNNYLQFLKYDSSVAMITTYENKIIHNEKMIIYLNRFGNLRGYFK